MKKLLVVAVCGFAIFSAIYIAAEGIQVGNYRIGKQASAFKESPFYKIYYSKDQLICLNLWASWCTTCLEEIPSLNKVKNTFAEDEVHFLSLSIDKDTDKLQRSLKLQEPEFKDITIQNLRYRSSIRKALNQQKPLSLIALRGIPTTYLIKNGKVLKTFHGRVNTVEIAQYIREYK